MSDSFQVPREQWERFDEPYKITYRKYIDVQHKKDDDAYSVPAALTRSQFFEQADPGWRTSMLLHYASITVGELGAGLAEAKMARFGKAPGMRNMATFGLLDEIRHPQMQLFFGHENISKDPRFDWVQKMYHSDHWAAIAARANLDDVELSRDAARTDRRGCAQSAVGEWQERTCPAAGRRCVVAAVAIVRDYWRTDR